MEDYKHENHNKAGSYGSHFGLNGKRLSVPNRKQPALRFN